jgi:hypothetical protein
MADKEKETAETVEFMGKTCKIVTKTNGTEKVIMSKNDFDAILNEKGVTPQMRDKIRQVDDEIVQEALKFSSERLLKANKGLKDDDPKFISKGQMILGQGSGSITTTITPHRVWNGVDRETKKPISRDYYGEVEVTKGYAFGHDARKPGGIVSAIQDAFERRYGVKK